MGTTHYAYDADGNLTGTVTPGGRSSTATYDALGLVTERTFADGSLTSFTYDARRNVTSVTDTGPGGANPKTVSFAYDDADRVTLVTDPDGQTVAYHYDSAGRRDRIATSAGLTMEYAFDSLGRLASVARNGTVEVTYGYDAAGRLATKTFANGTVTAYSFDALGRTTRIEHRGPGGAVLDFRDYAYSPEGRIASLTTNGGVTTYEYDALGQLTGVTRPDGSSDSYAYDANGNRLGYGANDADQYTTTPTGGGFTYDADGNLTAATDTPNQEQTTYGYDARGRLVSQNGPAGTISYEYDPLGNRTAIVKNGIRTVLTIDTFGGADGLGDVLAETMGGATTTYLIGVGIEVRYDAAGNTRYYHSDYQGSTVAMTDDAGAVTATYDYDAFGAVRGLAGADAAGNVVRFNGAFGVVDRGTGVLEMRNRFYDPETGRFTQRDPSGLNGREMNLYRFANNDPVSKGDPNGLSWYDYIYREYQGYLEYLRQQKAIKDAANAAKRKALGQSPDAATGGGGLGTNSGGDPNSAAYQRSETTISDELAEESGNGSHGGGGSHTYFKLLGIGTGIVLTAGLMAAVAPPAAAAAGATGTALAVAEGVGALAGPLFFAADVLGAALDLGTIAHSFYLLKDVPGSGYLLTPPNQDVINVPPEFPQELEDLFQNDPIFEGYVDIYRNVYGQDPPLSWYYDQLRLLGYRLIRVDGKLVIIRRSADPNDIVGPAGFGASGFLQPVGPFGYTIRFQNLPTATAPAQVVTVTQQLDDDFDWDTFELKTFGWADYEFSVPAGLQSYQTRVSDPARDAIVDIDARFDPATGLLTWTLTTLDPVTLDQPLDSVTAGFLPPDDATGVGQGFLGYAVRPKANAPTGTRYDAQARIVFDTEAPLNTPAIFNTADSSPPTVTVNALPATTPSNQVTVSWTGADDTGGSGVATTNVFVSVNGGAWAPWLSDSTLTSATYTGVAGQTVAFYATTQDNVNLASAVPAAAQASTTLGAQVANNPLLVGVPQFAVGGPGTVTTFNPDGTVRFTLTPFAGFAGEVRVAVADVTGDGVGDLVVGTGPGRATQVKVFDGVTKAELLTIDPFEASFTGGVYVAAGDLTGDGRAEIVITPDEGGGPRVRIFNADGFGQVADFFGIDDPNFRGGARAAVGDLDGDGRGDLLVAAGFGGGPRLAGFDGSKLGSSGGPKLFGDFFAFEETLRNGVFVAAGDVNGDGFADVVAGGGPGGGPRVYILDGKSLVQTGSDTLVSVGNYFAGDPDSRAGVRVAIKDLDGDTRADIVASATPTRVVAYRGSQTTPLGGTPPTTLDFDDIVGGIFVG